VINYNSAIIQTEDVRKKDDKKSSYVKFKNREELESMINTSKLMLDQQNSKASRQQKTLDESDNFGKRKE